MGFIIKNHDCFSYHEQPSTLLGQLCEEKEATGLKSVLVALWKLRLLAI